MVNVNGVVPPSPAIILPPLRQSAILSIRQTTLRQSAILPPVANYHPTPSPNCKCKPPPRVAKMHPLANMRFDPPPTLRLTLCTYGFHALPEPALSDVLRPPPGYDHSIDGQGGEGKMAVQLGGNLFFFDS